MSRGSVARLAVLAAAISLSACATGPRAFVEAGLGDLGDNPRNAGSGDVIDAANPRGVIAAGVLAPITDRIELSATVRHESAPLVNDYGTWGFCAAVRVFLFR